MRLGRFSLIIALVGASLASGANPPDLPDFGDLSLDQLANVKITSFTNKEQKLSQVAGAVYVITAEQIARSGLTSVPELLRLVPGIDVAQVNGNQWSIGARGPTGVYANKLLVLIDGRSVYSPVFSGVFWEIGMPLVDDIERIEVIRGPGATIWGANAVLGVINIITRNARDTQGTMVTSGGGSSERASGSARFGGAVGSTSYRGYFGGSDSAPLSQQSGASANDGFSEMQGGFRLDGSNRKNTWMLEGDLFRAAESDIGADISFATQRIVDTSSRADSLAGNFNGFWRRRFGETGELRIQSYYDYSNHPEPQISKLESDTWDTEFQYDFKAGHVHNLSVGGGERLISESVSIQPETISFFPAALTYSNLNAFAQDEMHFVHDTLLVTLGAKLELNHFGGLGLEPSANLLWMPARHHSIWISTARSLRTPSLFEIAVDGPYDIYPGTPATGGLPIVTGFKGSPAFAAEAVRDFEIGYRAQLSRTFSVDLAAFYDRFSSMRSFVIGNPVFASSPVPSIDVSESVANGVEATGKGIEGSLAWQVLRDWKLEASYSYNLTNERVGSSAPPGSVDAGEVFASRDKWRLQSYVNLSRSWKLDTFLYWNSQASPPNPYGPDIPVPSYTRLDIRLGYKAGPHWQLSLAGQNLLQARHLEGLPELLTTYSYVNRSVYLKSTWQF